ncbi:2-hydroxyhepta-2,4-diene-1,7-dioate isomerase [Gordonia sp. HNM0687]|uniref:2-hydroxyhepta-2,4-diene-1,7-dioate isomerase n=1 Tax=Gordonia mangrovi TaxID=2665643 RepID=A0A6L7GXQ6_9ACTN|nr:fumarylacetoacetate hydrolase family protein [Gordonia mangrovi]MXP23388.1 2-hydroxyhepta-2,4-diene-1,7-dioate isomerase [Gordonia mangrovi]UVF76709.1 fumarylacetoacetate hydrolase family protein [Gordonia mangrovi]
MKYASYQYDGVDHVGEVRGTSLIPLGGVSAIGLTTTPDVLRDAPRKTADAVDTADVTLLPVVVDPRKIVCVGLNYMSHITETGRDLPEYPVLFPKYASGLIGAGDALVLPPESKQVDWEGELAVVIGRGGRRIAEEDALDHVLGYTVANDITMRDYQYKTHQFMAGKIWDRTTPLGPYLVTPDEVDVANAGIRTVLNGDTVQDSNLSYLIFSVARLISLISEVTELTPGDVILTGTPGGVGFRMDPKVFLKDGDVVTVSIDGVGELRTRVSVES